jgi:secretory phospholipase A2
MQIEEPFGLYRCCNQHDACFATCGTAAPFCERIFKQCMSKVCAEDHVGQTREDCERQATSMSTMTGAFGGGFHLASQRGDLSSGRLGACDCYDDAAAAERRWLDVFAQFYREHGHPPMNDAVAREKAREVVRKNTGARRGAAYFRALRKYNATTLSSERLFAWDNVRAEL